jgi:hypothetical protein
MATYFPPKKNTAFRFFVTLVSQANTKVFQTNPTFASGDVKVSTDGAAFANLTTLPVVTPSGGKGVQVDLSASEMNGDNILIVFSDAAGAEWADVSINLQTTVRQIDDLAYPTVSGRSLDVTATGAAGIDWANVENPTTSLNLSGTNIDVDQVVASVSGAVGSVATVSDKTGYSLSAGGIQAIWDALTSALTTVGSVGKLLVDNINTTISSRLASASYTAPLDAAGTRTAVGLASANLDAQLGDLPTAAENATQVRTELTTELGRIDAATSTRATPAQVNTEVVDALAVDTYAEPGQGAPAATVTLAAKIGHLYKAFRNQKKQTSSQFTLYADDATTVDAKATVSDDGTTTTIGEMVSGP